MTRDREREIDREEERERGEERDCSCQQNRTEGGAIVK
jgi:hypothetical protein